MSLMATVANREIVQGNNSTLVFNEVGGWRGKFWRCDSVQGDKNRASWLVVGDARPVAVAGEVLHQQNIAAAERSFLAAADFYFDFSVEQKNVLSLRRVVPAVVVVCVVLAKKN